MSATDAATSTEQVLTVTDAALAAINELREAEPDGEHLGLQVEIVDRDGPEFRYDLYFEMVTKTDITDVIRNHDGLKVIVGAGDVDDLDGATLDYELGQLVLRNPNQPQPLQLGTLTTTTTWPPRCARSSTRRSTRRSRRTAASSPSWATTARARSI